MSSRRGDHGLAFQFQLQNSKLCDRKRARHHAKTLKPSSQAASTLRRGAPKFYRRKTRGVVHDEEKHGVSQDEGMPYSRKSVLYGLLPPTRANVRHDSQGGSAHDKTEKPAPKPYASGVLEAIEERRRLANLAASDGVRTAVGVGSNLATASDHPQSRTPGLMSRHGHRGHASPGSTLLRAQSVHPGPARPSAGPRGGSTHHRRSVHRLVGRGSLASPDSGDIGQIGGKPDSFPSPIGRHASPATPSGRHRRGASLAAGKASTLRSPWGSGCGGGLHGSDEDEDEGHHDAVEVHHDDHEGLLGTTSPSRWKSPVGGTGQSIGRRSGRGSWGVTAGLGGIGDTVPEEEDEGGGDDLNTEESDSGSAGGGSDGERMPSVPQGEPAGESLASCGRRTPKAGLDRKASKPNASVAFSKGSYRAIGGSNSLNDTSESPQQEQRTLGRIRSWRQGTLGRVGSGVRGAAGTIGLEFAGAGLGGRDGLAGGQAGHSGTMRRPSWRDPGSMTMDDFVGAVFEVPPEKGVEGPDGLAAATSGEGEPAQGSGRPNMLPNQQRQCCSSEASMLLSEGLMRVAGILPWWGEASGGTPRMAWAIMSMTALLTVVWVILPPLARFLASNAAEIAAERGASVDWEALRFGYTRGDFSVEMEDEEYGEGGSSASKAADSSWFAAVQSAMLQLAIMLPWYSMVGARSEFALGKRFRARLTKAVVELEDEFEDEEDDLGQEEIEKDGGAVALDGDEETAGAEWKYDEDDADAQLGDWQLSSEQQQEEGGVPDKQRFSMGTYEPPAVFSKEADQKATVDTETRLVGTSSSGNFGRPRAGSGQGILQRMGGGSATVYRASDAPESASPDVKGLSLAGDLHIPMSAAQHHKSSVQGQSDALSRAKKNWNRGPSLHRDAGKSGWGARRKAHKHHELRKQRNRGAAAAVAARKDSAQEPQQRAITRSITSRFRPHSSSDGSAPTDSLAHPLLESGQLDLPISRHSSLQYAGSPRASIGRIDHALSGATAESSATSLSGVGAGLGGEMNAKGGKIDVAGSIGAVEGDEEASPETVLSPACTAQLKQQASSVAWVHLTVTGVFGLAIVCAWVGCATYQLHAAAATSLPGGLPPMSHTKGAVAGLLPVRVIGLLPGPRWVRIVAGAALVALQVLTAAAGCIGMLSFALLCAEARLQLDQLTFEMVDAHAAASAADEAEQAAAALAKAQSASASVADRATGNDDGLSDEEGGASASGSLAAADEADELLSIATASSGGSFGEHDDELEAAEIQEMVQRAARATQCSSLLSSGDAAESLLSAYQSAAHFIYRMSEANGASVGTSVVLSFVLLLCVLIDTVSQTDEGRKGGTASGASGAWGAHFVLLAALCVWMLLPLYCVALIAERSHVFQRDSAMAVVSSPAFGKTSTGEKTLLGAYLNGTQPSLRLLGVEISMETVKEVSILLIGALTVVLKLLFSVEISLG